ncbi:hypothetical protein DCAR_0100571 [Daucus carota subsp. sativus]|uniref:Uncharacterized protein n=1 Tax=Daucus carota subsp. sativus TaxID=79200 RepID=A0A166FRS0_DAUCS|nr:hypothetical protein DCAR_0100571 [Daucus carota subsp. sativus]
MKHKGGFPGSGITQSDEIKSSSQTQAVSRDMYPWLITGKIGLTELMLQVCCA